MVKGGCRGRQMKEERGCRGRQMVKGRKKKGGVGGDRW